MVKSRYQFVFADEIVKCCIVISPAKLGIKSASTYHFMKGMPVEPLYDVQQRYALIQTIPLLCRTNEPQLNPTIQYPA
ncbi:MAG: hypothetical protein EZS28_021062 [Streblomastix strix]|uniref:Uncharacterized protein n=1 Tax=Streblomastix strix TaxID=222440 RepID=A0A5J4VLD7_9EUKA|nr:MAG: hypothetical protein EZS28_021062 [Streblomastix strix]